MKFWYRDQKTFMSRGGIKSFCQMYDLHWKQATTMFRTQRDVIKSTAHPEWQGSKGLYNDGLLSLMIRYARIKDNAKELHDRLSDIYGNLKIIEVFANLS